MAVQFKLTKANGLTRRITFAARPTWYLLSTRIADLYDIAIENVGVSYTDSDGDDVTLSSDEELQDFYTSVLTPDDGTIKLAVHDLSSLRAATIASPSLPSATPQQSHFRNTFGGHEVLPLVFDAEDEWQRLPGSLGSLFLSKDAPESPHAFVEVLESDVSVSKSEAADSGGGNASPSDLTFTRTAFQNKDKGKGRAATVEDDVSSAGSVIGDEAPNKPPVHVFEVHPEGMFGLSRGSAIQPSRSGVATPAQAQSTPVISEQTLKAHESTVAEEQKTENPDDDPPLPSLDLPGPDRVPPSLVHDIATLLTAISTVLSTHPELSERLRNIVTNTTNGTYWAAHREAVSRAAESFHRTAIQETGRNLEEFCRATEQEASARVTETLGRIFSTVVAQDGQENINSQTPRNVAQVSSDGVSNMPRSPPNRVPNFPRFLHLPPHPRRSHHSWFTPPSSSHPGGPSWSGLAPPPPPPPPLSPRGWPRPPPPRFWGRDVEQPEPVVNGQEARAAMAEVLAAAAEARERAAEQHAQITTVHPSSTLDATPERLRAEVERAKADYKARKEMYRQAKAIRKMSEQRRRDPESTTERLASIARYFSSLNFSEYSISRQTSDNPTPVTPDRNVPIVITNPTPENQAVESNAATSEVHIVSNARGRYPQLEMFSVPKRSHTTSHMHRGHVHENKENRPLSRIMRKLSDVCVGCP